MIWSLFRIHWGLSTLSSNKLRKSPHIVMPSPDAIRTNGLQKCMKNSKASNRIRPGDSSRFHPVTKQLASDGSSLANMMRKVISPNTMCVCLQTDIPTNLDLIMMKHMHPSSRLNMSIFSFPLLLSLAYWWFILMLKTRSFTAIAILQFIFINHQVSRTKHISIPFCFFSNHYIASSKYLKSGTQCSMIRLSISASYLANSIPGFFFCRNILLAIYVDDILKFRSKALTHQWIECPYSSIYCITHGFSHSSIHLRSEVFQQV